MRCLCLRCSGLAEVFSAGRRACRRVCWGGAGECSCGAPVVAKHLPARVRRADARGLITPSCHPMKASVGSTRPTQSPSQTPQGENTTGGKQHRGETAHGETHPPTRGVGVCVGGGHSRETPNRQNIIRQGRLLLPRRPPARALVSQPWPRAGVEASSASARCCPSVERRGVWAKSLVVIRVSITRLFCIRHKIS